MYKIAKISNGVQQIFDFSLDDMRALASASLIALIIFAFGGVAYNAYGAAVTLTVTVAQTLTFTTSTDQFGTLTPGTYKIATTTLSIDTNDTAGWNVALSGDTQSLTDTVCDLDADAAAGITDQTEWVPGAATTTVGNAVVRASLASSGDVLAFRVMSASSTNGAAFLAATWWGASDADGTALWAGIASSTVSRQIGNAGTGSYSATAHLNTVNYYLDVANSQQQGAYSCPLTYTATGN